MYFLAIFVVSASVFGTGAADPVARLVGGDEPQSLGLFPHHVVISSLRGRNCGGSILNSNWVLTSAACVQQRSTLNLYFGKTNLKSYIGNFFDVTVKSEQIRVYDSVALIRLQKPIQFSDTIRPVGLSRASVDGLSNRFAVMPGFSEGKLATVSSGSLKYGIFMIQEVAECQRLVGGGQFRDDRRLCTKGWGGNLNVPCDSDIGSGLIVGWPSGSEIVGIFAESRCEPGSPAVYIHLGRYLPWIEGTIAP